MSSPRGSTRASWPIVYGHPERRLGRMPEVLRRSPGRSESRSLVWRATFPDLARWWRWRAERKWLVIPRDGPSPGDPVRRVGPEYDLALEIHRGDFYLLDARDRPADVAGPERAGLPADEGCRDRCPDPPEIDAALAEPQAGRPDRDRLGDRDALERDPAVVAVEPREARAAVVEAQTSEGRRMSEPTRPPIIASAPTPRGWPRGAGASAPPARSSCTRRPSPSRRRAGARTSWSRPAGTSSARRPASGCSRRGPIGLESARLLHLFGMSREGLELARLARSQRRAGGRSRRSAGTSPARSRRLESSLARKAAGLAALVPAVDHPRVLPSWRRELLQLADVVLPNSRAEARPARRLFGVARERIRVVPNGVLPSFGTASPEPFRERWGPDPFVLSVGRIEPRKNTLGLVQRDRQLGLPLVSSASAVPGY